MQTHEYKVVSAPRKGEKARGLKSTEDRFAHALSKILNEFALEGWEYLRTDTLPVEERTGLTGRVTTSFQSVLVFRRPLKSAVRPGAEPGPVVAISPEPAATSAVPKLTTEAKDGAAPALGAALADKP